MRGLTKEEAAVLRTHDGVFRPNVTRKGAPDYRTRQDLLDAGRCKYTRYEPGHPRYEYATGVWTITPLGKLALRVHQLCVERGLA